MKVIRASIILAIAYLVMTPCNGQVLDQKISKYMDAKDPIEQYDLFSDIMFGNSDYTTTELKNEAALNLRKSEALSDPRYESMAYSILGDAYYLSGLRDSAQYYYLLQASCLDDKVTSNSHQTLIASGLGNAANTSSTLGKKAYAISLAMEALPFAKSLGDPRGEADLYYVLAQAYNSMIEVDSALFYFDKCYQINLAAEDKRSLTSNILLIGNIYKTQEKYEEALVNYKKILPEIFDTSQYYFERSMVFSEMASVYQNIDKVDSALYYIQEARSQRAHIKRSHYDNRIDLKYVDILIKNEQYEKASQLLTTLFSRMSSDENLSVVLGVRSSCVNLYLATASYEKAEECLVDALDIIASSDLQNQKLKFYPLSIELYERLGKTSTALKYSKLYGETLKRYNTDEVERAVLISDFKYEKEQLNRQNEISKLENELLSSKLQKRKISSIILSTVLVGLFLLFYFFRRQQKEKERLTHEVKSAIIAKKEKLYMEKEMEALRAQMNPHFLFNSLNSINYYILNEEPREASNYLTKFSQLMRSILANSKERYVTLDQELRAMRLYTEIENVRFDKRFEYIERIDIDVDIGNIYIPPMIIQPFIENSIKHAFVGVAHQCVVKLEVSQKDGQLVIIISDNGIGRERSSKLKSRSREEKRSLGLDITKDRLDLISKLYNFHASMDIEDVYDEEGASRGTKIVVRIPIQYKSEN